MSLSHHLLQPCLPTFNTVVGSWSKKVHSLNVTDIEHSLKGQKVIATDATAFDSI